MKKLTSLIVLITSVLLSFSVFAASPMGNWKTIDDITGRPKAIVHISGSARNLSGSVIKLLPGATTSICSACSGNLKNKPIVGMTIMWGMSQDPSNPNVWTGGSIMDPKTGKVYHCKLTVSPDGRTMDVRGYIGFTLLGRSQTWYRQ